MIHHRHLQKLIRGALREDVGQEDLTTRLTVPARARCRVRLTAKQDGILSGIGIFRAVFDEMDGDMIDWQALSDGAPFTSGQELASFSALTRATLTAERTALNFLQHLSGVATLTAQHVAAVNGFDVRICDTRKTTPLFRDLEKAAVVHGGGHNHRQSLQDGILIKENHIVAAGGIAQAVSQAKSGTHHLMKIETEVTNLDECREAVEAGAEVIMLDNMPLDDMRSAVDTYRDRAVQFEASGNVSLDTIRDIAATGVHIISVGALTHSAPAADISLLIEQD
jgi:nicotinate-nucleotide pyrophosphorylase (carboxylating)